MKVSAVLSLFLAGAAFAGPIGETQRRQSAGYAEVYSEVNFQGESAAVIVTQETTCLNVTGGLKNNIQSMRIHGNINCNIYPATDCQGDARATIGRDVPDLASSGISKDATSIKCIRKHK